MAVSCGVYLNKEILAAAWRDRPLAQLVRLIELYNELEVLPSMLAWRPTHLYNLRCSHLLGCHFLGSSSLMKNRGDLNCRLLSNSDHRRCS